MKKPRIIRMIGVAVFFVSVFAAVYVVWDKAPTTGRSASKAEVKDVLTKRVPLPPRPSVLTVAVMDFTTDARHYSERVAVIGLAGLAHTLIEEAPGVRWVDREQIAAARGELGLMAGLGASSRVDLRIGRFVKADLIIRGHLATSEAGLPILRLKTIDLLRAQTLSQRDLKPDIDKAPGIVERFSPQAIAQSIEQMVAQAHQQLNDTTADRIVACLFFVNLSSTDRLDYFENEILQGLEATTTPGSGVRVLRFANASDALHEQELALLGLTDTDPDAWRKVADYYAWGSYQEIPPPPLTQAPFSQIEVRVTLNLWDGLNPPQQLIHTTTVAQLPQARQHLATQLANTIKGPAPAFRSTHAQSQTVANLMRRSQELRRQFTPIDYPTSSPAKKQTRYAIHHYRQRLMEVAAFFDPDNQIVREQSLELKYNKALLTDPANGWELSWRQLRETRQHMDFFWDRATYLAKADLLKRHVQAITHLLKMMRAPVSGRDVTPQNAHNIGKNDGPDWLKEAAAAIPFGITDAEVNRLTASLITRLNNLEPRAAEMIQEQQRLTVVQGKTESGQTKSIARYPNATVTTLGKQPPLFRETAYKIIDAVLYARHADALVADTVDRWWPHAKSYYTDMYAAANINSASSIRSDPKRSFEYRLARLLKRIGRLDDITRLLWIDTQPRVIKTTRTQGAAGQIAPTPQPNIFERTARADFEQAKTQGKLSNQSGSHSPSPSVMLTSIGSGKNTLAPIKQPIKREWVTGSGKLNPDLQIKHLSAPAHPVTLSSNQSSISQLLTIHASHGLLWASFVNNSVYGTNRRNIPSLIAFDPATESIFNLSKTLIENNIDLEPVHTIQHNANHLWLGTHEQYTLRFDTHNLSAKPFNNNHGLRSKKVHHIQTINDKLFVIGDGETVNVFNPTANAFDDISLDGLAPRPLSISNYARPWRLLPFHAANHWLVFGGDNPVAANLQTRQTLDLNKTLIEQFQNEPPLKIADVNITPLNSTQINDYTADEHAIWMTTNFALYRYQHEADQWDRWPLPVLYMPFRLLADGDFIWLFGAEPSYRLEDLGSSMPKREFPVYVFNAQNAQWGQALTLGRDARTFTIDQQRLWIAYPGLYSKANILEVDKHAVYNQLTDQPLPQKPSAPPIPQAIRQTLGGSPLAHDIYRANTPSDFQNLNDLNTVHLSQALRAAVRAGQNQIIEALLQRGADPFDSIHHANQQSSAATLAGQFGRYQAMRLFIQYANGRDTLNNLKPPLMAAVQNGHVQTVSLIIQAIQPRPPLVLPDVTKAIAQAISLAHVNQRNDVLTQITRFASAASKAKQLQAAVHTGIVNAVTQVIDAGVDPNLRLDNGQTALTLALENNTPQLIAPLLKAGADPNLRSANGATPPARRLLPQSLPIHTTPSRSRRRPQRLQQNPKRATQQHGSIHPLHGPTRVLHPGPELRGHQPDDSTRPRSQRRLLRHPPGTIRHGRRRRRQSVRRRRLAHASRLRYQCPRSLRLHRAAPQRLSLQQRLGT